MTVRQEQYEALTALRTRLLALKRQVEAGEVPPKPRAPRKLTAAEKTKAIEAMRRTRLRDLAVDERRPMLAVGPPAALAWLGRTDRELGALASEAVKCGAPVPRDWQEGMIGRTLGSRVVVLQSDAQMHLLAALSAVLTEVAGLLSDLEADGVPAPPATERGQEQQQRQSTAPQAEPDDQRAARSDILPPAYDALRVQPLLYRLAATAYNAPSDTFSRAWLEGVVWAESGGMGPDNINSPFNRLKKFNDPPLPFTLHLAGPNVLRKPRALAQPDSELPEK